MRAIFCVLLIIYTGIASGQIKMKMDSLFEIQGELYKIIEYKTDLPIEVRDSLNKVYLMVNQEITKLAHEKDSLMNIVYSMQVEYFRLSTIADNDSTLTKAQRDSLWYLAGYILDNSSDVLAYLRTFLERRDSLLQLSSALKDHSAQSTQIIQSLISIATNPDVYGQDRRDALAMLAATRHPAALTFLMENIMIMGYPDPDPPPYNRTDMYDNYYVQYDAYPCVNYLRKHADWYMLPYFEAAIEKKVIPEIQIILYAFLLDDIMKHCKPCREAFLTGYKEYPERTEAIRIRTINANQIMEFYKNPKTN